MPITAVTIHDLSRQIQNKLARARIKTFLDAVKAVADSGSFGAGTVTNAMLASTAVTASKIVAGTITGTQIANATLDGTQIKVAAAGNTIPAVPVEYIIAVADGSTGNVDTTVDATVGKFTVTNVRVLKNASAGGASDTIQVSNGTVSTPISDAISINVAANVVANAGTILSANAVVSSAAVLRVTRTKASAANVGCTVLVTGFKTT